MRHGEESLVTRWKLVPICSPNLCALKHVLHMETAHYGSKSVSTKLLLKLRDCDSDGVISVHGNLGRGPTLP